jgi:hypothetical protein
MSPRDILERDGYLIVRNVIPDADIRRLREQLVAHFARRWTSVGLGKHQPNAAIEIPAIGWIFSYAPMVSLFRELLGEQRVVFTGNCDAHMNMLSHWHKDTSENQGGCLRGDYFSRRDCRVYRAGIYLQDHHENRQGLTVRKASHLTRSISEGEIEYLPTRAGDIVFFDIRLSHAGQLPDRFERSLLNLGRRLHAPRLASAAKALYARARDKDDKLSIFLTYGTTGSDTEDFCNFELRAKTRQQTGRPLHLGADLAAGLRAADVLTYAPFLPGHGAPAGAPGNGSVRAVWA